MLCELGKLIFLNMSTCKGLEQHLNPPHSPSITLGFLTKRKHTYPQEPKAKWETNTNFINKIPILSRLPLLRSLNSRMTSCLSRCRVYFPNYLDSMPSLPYPYKHWEKLMDAKWRKGRCRDEKKAFHSPVIPSPGDIWSKEYFRHWPIRLF